MSESEIAHLKKHLSESLEKCEKSILKEINYDYGKRGVLYNKNPLDVKETIHHFKHKFGEEIISELNLTTLFRKIDQILQLKKRDTKKVIRQEFINYIQSLDGRIDVICRKTNADNDDHFDEYEGEHSKIPRKTYEHEKYQLDVELSKLQRWIEKNREKVCIVFEGRDSAGKGSAIKRFVERMNPRVFKVVALGMPSEDEKEHWFERYERHLPRPGEVVLFDRSWYNRAVVEPVMGYCTEKQYTDFMENVLDWEESLIEKGIILIKFWFSITKEKQELRFQIRQNSPIKYWKYSENDSKVVDKWDVITKYKNMMFNKTSSPISPWVVINSNDKRIGRLNSIRYALDKIPYEDKETDLLQWYPEVVTIVT